MRGRGPDYTDREAQIIGLMMKAERTLPDDFWCVPMVQEMACLFAKVEGFLSEEQCATIIGIGAFLARHGKVEMAAEIEAAMKLSRLAKGAA